MREKATPPDMMRRHEAVMRDTRDRILETVLEHESICHDGVVCQTFRAGVVAYFGHCLGVAGPAWEEALVLRLELDAMCESRGIKCQTHHE